MMQIAIISALVGVALSMRCSLLAIFPATLVAFGTVAFAQLAAGADFWPLAGAAALAAATFQVSYVGATLVRLSGPSAPDTRADPRCMPDFSNGSQYGRR